MTGTKTELRGKADWPEQSVASAATLNACSSLDCFIICSSSDSNASFSFFFYFSNFSAFLKHPCAWINRSCTTGSTCLDALPVTPLLATLPHKEAEHKAQCAILSSIHPFALRTIIAWCNLILICIAITKNCSEPPDLPFSRFVCVRPAPPHPTPSITPL